MFTGIIQDVGTVMAFPCHGDSADLTVKTKLSLLDWNLGDSVAVNGCCLTVTEYLDSSTFCAQLSPETLAVTTLDRLQPGDALNLEPALRANDRLGGHMVTGHVDGVATVRRVAYDGDFCLLEFALPGSLARYVVTKGSVAVNGVSLTVNAVSSSGFGVSLIPHTLEQTNLSDLTVGMQVNLETDMMARYVERQLQFLDINNDGVMHVS
ncbi:MAG: riboflavin synthase [Mariprofundales bacterium]